MRKLGSLLGIEEDLNRRIQLAMMSFKNLEKLWKHRNLVAERVRILSYRALVESVLLYNCGTWSLTEVQSDRIDRCQRKMIRRVLGVKCVDKISNKALYERCNILPASIQAQSARWRLFGHTLRLHSDTPARKAMAYYFKKDQPGRKGNRVTIATAISSDFKLATGVELNSMKEYMKS